MPLLSGAQRNRARAQASSPAHTQQPRRAARLPDYEPLSFPLEAASRAKLAELSNNASMRTYEDQLKQSIRLLTNNVRDINDRHVKRKDELSKLKRQHQSQGEDDGEDDELRKRQRAGEAAVDRLHEAVPSLTDDCERAIRDIIDLRVELADSRGAMSRTLGEIESEGARLFEYESAKREKEEAKREKGAKTEGEDGDQAEAENDDMDIVRPQILGPMRILKKERQKAAADYATRSMEERYAVDNDYIGFKRLWWDAVHAVDGKPLPDSSRWFTGNTARDDEDAEEEDEDVVIAEEHLSIYCPLSMVVMDEPYTSNVCKHTFNKPAIVQYLRGQPGHKATCPQTGCSRGISLKDFYDDQVMLRQIERQQAENLKRDVDEDEDKDDVYGDSSMAQ
ncbi:hypothetical protein F4808DRAFT_106230 [Astrocystis sublimbata]|nr:hypothetical protein F4808DRAFT_106230 [Astrocystis sublimbata]